MHISPINLRDSGKHNYRRVIIKTTFVQRQLHISTGILQRRDHQHHFYGYRQLDLEGVNKIAGDTFQDGSDVRTSIKSSYLIEGNNLNPVECYISGLFSWPVALHRRNLGHRT